MALKREDCWMTFTEALEQYLTHREDLATAPTGCQRWEDDMEKIREASEHMDALTGGTDEH